MSDQNKQFESELEEIAGMDQKNLVILEGMKEKLDMFKDILSKYDQDPSVLNAKQIENLPRLKELCDELEAKLKIFFEASDTRDDH